jgi:hypothetical protein
MVKKLKEMSMVKCLRNSELIKVKRVSFLKRIINIFRF